MNKEIIDNFDGEYIKLPIFFCQIWQILQKILFHFILFLIKFWHLAKNKIAKPCQLAKLNFAKMPKFGKFIFGKTKKDYNRINIFNLMKVKFIFIK